MHEYLQFTRKLALTTACTVLLSSAITGLIQSLVGVVAPYFPTWPFMLAEMVLASLGLWYLTKNGKRKRGGLDVGKNKAHDIR